MVSLRGYLGLGIFLEALRLGFNTHSESRISRAFQRCAYGLHMAYDLNLVSMKQGFTFVLKRTE